MSSYKIGFVGVGVMGEAILNGALHAGYIAPEEIYVHDIDHGKLIGMVDRYAVNPCVSIDELLEKSDIILAAVKPFVFKQMLEDISQKIKGKALVSIVAGWSTQKIKNVLTDETRVLCIMPNMPALCGEGMSVLSSNNTLLPDELQFVTSLFGSFGDTELIDEKYFDIVTGISGSGPAYVFMFIEAMMSAGIYNGLPAKTARKLAVQTVLGAAKTLKLNDRHPADMRDAVCTPAGTTIEGVFELEKSGFNGVVISAIDKTAKKYKQMVNN
jgi:pyrroline-5-carboxylate reductase